MMSFWVEREENAVVYTIPAKTRIFFVVSYSIFSVLLFLVIASVLLGFFSFWQHNFLANFGLGMFVVFIFLVLLVFMVNSIIYYLIGMEVIKIKANNMVEFYRNGFYRFQKKGFTLDKLKSISLKKTGVDIVGDFTDHEEGCAKIEIVFLNKPKNVWGEDISRIGLGASLSDAEANRFLKEILKDLEIMKIPPLDLSK